MAAKWVILVGHGGMPSDCPGPMVAEFKKLESAHKGAPSARLLELDRTLRDWPRTPETDPYKPGLEAIAAALQGRLTDWKVVCAYNEFCAPSVEEAFDDAAAKGARTVVIITTMYTRGGSHSEREIPEIVARLKAKNPGIDLRYAWPFDLEAVSSMLSSEVLRAISR
ncbi:MAG: CbiX/SirB N-terminal domain-containing protein [Elusimicrobia bacterium]|nr:CbiX/SirB N-terminal domain-containing protein [Elusimicrobiota bacterium]